LVLGSVKFLVCEHDRSWTFVFRGDSFPTSLNSTILRTGTLIGATSLLVSPYVPSSLYVLVDVSV
jgi:hypothetical protein